MANRNIQMKHKNGTGWDILLPITHVENVLDDNGKTVAEKLAETQSVANTAVKSVNEVLPSPEGNVNMFKVFKSIPNLEEFNRMSEGELGFIKDSIIDVPYFNSYNSASDQTKELPLGNVRGPNSPYRAYVSFVPDESIAVKKITTRMVGQVSDGIEHVAGDPVRVRVYANSAFTGLLGTAIISNVTSESGVLFDGVAEFVNPVSMNGGTKYFFLYDIPNFTGENSYRVFGAAENNYENLYRGYERSSGFTEDAFDPYVQIYIS